MKVKNILASLVILSVLPLAACGDKSEYTTEDGTKVKVDKDMTETNVTTEKEIPR